jgi:putative transposase
MRTERILIKPDHKNHASFRYACGQANKVSNLANYQIRQAFFNGEILSWASADKIIKLHFEEHYSSIPNAASQAIIKRLGKDWKSFFKALQSWKKNPNKFKARPKPPKRGYKLKTYTHPFQSMQCIDNEIHFPKKLNILPIKVRCCENQALREKDKAKHIIKEIRFVPHGHCFWLEVVHDEHKALKTNKMDVLLNKDRALAIDYGVNNFLTIVTNVVELNPLLINGKVIKSINQRYNKKKAYYQSQGNKAMIEKLGVRRFCQLTDIFHKISHQLLNYCLLNDIGTVVIGKNDGWKQDINIGKVNNQTFVNIPYNSMTQKIKYKLEEFGIDVIEQEESYTSKSDALVCDSLPTYGVKKEEKKQKHTFKGKRVKRGLYQSSIGKLINADVNGALNILRKVIGDGFIVNLANKGFVFNPVKGHFTL